MRHPSGAALHAQNMRHPSGNPPLLAQKRHPSGAGVRPRNMSSSSSGPADHGGVDLAALAALVGAGPGPQGKAAPPLTAINLEDLGKRAKIPVLRIQTILMRIWIRIRPLNSPRIQI
jgi:hypothetical protein